MVSVILRGFFHGQYIFISAYCSVELPIAYVTYYYLAAILSADSLSHLLCKLIGQDHFFSTFITYVLMRFLAQFFVSTCVNNTVVFCATSEHDHLLNCELLINRSRINIK